MRRRSGCRSASASLIAVGFVVALAPQIVDLMGVEGVTADFAVTYMRIAALGLPFAFLALGGQGYLRGVADLRTPLVIVIAANVVNLVLEVLFVYGFGWGIEGSAWGTVIAQAGMGAAFIVVILRAVRGDTRPSLELMRRLLVIGRYIFVRTAALLSAFTLAGAGSRGSATPRWLRTRSHSSSGSSSPSSWTQSRSPAR